MHKMAGMRVLVVADEGDPPELRSGVTRHWKLRFVETDYNNLNAVRAAVKREARGTDFALFTRNNQVFSHLPVGGVAREAGLGYSSVSALEEGSWKSGTMACFSDFLGCAGKLDFSPEKRLKSKAGDKTFSLAFDTEQFGGVKFGLPGILWLLEKLEIPATFFLTNIMAKVYRNLPDVLESAGHEVGIHGRFHEDLRMIKNHEAALRKMMKISTRIKGANFISRMDKGTLEAIATAGLEYFVYPLKNTSRLFAGRSDPVLVSVGV